VTFHLTLPPPILFATLKRHTEGELTESAKF
jgi:hypothetical protein